MRKPVKKRVSKGSVTKSREVVDVEKAESENEWLLEESEEENPKSTKGNDNYFISSEDEAEYDSSSGLWAYNLDEMRIKNTFFHPEMYKEMSAFDFSIGYVRQHGLEQPLLFIDSPCRLGIKMPEEGTFTISSLGRNVPNRIIDVIDVVTQGNRQMMLNEFIEYYETPAEERKELLNVLSLEFSLTDLAKKVRGPSFVKDLDWVELYWPKELQESEKTFPKIQNYCLMSVKGSFTDFHFDFGGTAVWYHVYKGRKTFWIVEPTEENLKKYEDWILKGDQYTGFFGDIVDKCARIELYEGNTFIIPSGWIHGVYTPEDSLVFGGNFLHAFSVPMQLNIIRSEDRIMVAKKYRYPMYHEMLWYVIIGIVKRATGQAYDADEVENEDAGTKNERVGKRSGPNADDTCNQGHAYDNDYILGITEMEREGYRSLLVYMRENLLEGLDEDERRKRSKLLDDFEKILDHEVCNHEQSEKDETKPRSEKSSDVAPKLSQWINAFSQQNIPSHGVKKKLKEKDKERNDSATIQPLLKHKIAKAKTKCKRPDHHTPDGPLIINGIPPAIMPAGVSQAPNPYGYDPLASVTPLGHKQLPTAYRRTANMAKVPPSQKFKLQPQVQKPKDEEAFLPNTEIQKDADIRTPILAVPEEGPKTARLSTEKVRSRHSHESEEKSTAHNDQIENHKDNRHSAISPKIEYPELQYKSPLARPGSITSNKDAGHDRFMSSYIKFKRRHTYSATTSGRRNEGTESRRSDSNGKWMNTPRPIWVQTNQPRTPVHADNSVHNKPPPSWISLSQRAEDLSSNDSYIEIPSLVPSPNFPVPKRTQSERCPGTPQKSEFFDEQGRSFSQYQRPPPTANISDAKTSYSGTPVVSLQGRSNWSPLTVTNTTTFPVMTLDQQQSSLQPINECATLSNLQLPRKVDTDERTRNRHLSWQIPVSSATVLIPGTFMPRHEAPCAILKPQLSPTVSQNASCQPVYGSVIRPVEAPPQIPAGGRDAQKVSPKPMTPEFVPPPIELGIPRADPLDYVTTVNELAKLAHEIDTSALSGSTTVVKKSEPSNMGDPRRRRVSEVSTEENKEMKRISKEPSPLPLPKQPKLSAEAVLENLSSLASEFDYGDDD